MKSFVDDLTQSLTEKHIFEVHLPKVIKSDIGPSSTKSQTFTDVPIIEDHLIKIIRFWGHESKNVPYRGGLIVGVVGKVGRKYAIFGILSKSP